VSPAAVNLPNLLMNHFPNSINEKKHTHTDGKLPKDLVADQDLQILSGKGVLLNPSKYDNKCEIYIDNKMGRQLKVNYQPSNPKPFLVSDNVELQYSWGCLRARSSKGYILTF
jgi:hypothetical protein